MNPAPPHTVFAPPQPPPPFAVPPPLFPYSAIPSAPFPPPIPTSSASDLPSALSSLTSLLRLTESTLSSFSSLRPIHSPTTPPLARCPFNPNHRIPPPSLFSHSLSCSSSSSSTHLDAELFLSSLHYPHTLQLTPDAHQLENLDSSELCFSLEKFLKFPENFYSDCPGAVSINACNDDPSFSQPVLMLPRILSVECANFKQTFRGLDENNSKVDSMKLLPSEIWSVRCEVDCWHDYPFSYSCRVLRSFSRLRVATVSHLHEWILVNSPTYGVVIDSQLADHIVLLFKLSVKAIVTESMNVVNLFIRDPGYRYDMKFECPSLVETMRWFGCQLSILYGEVNGRSFALGMLKQCVLDSASSSSIFPMLEKNMDSPIEHDGPVKKSGEDERKTTEDEDVTSRKIYVSRVAAAVAALHERSWLELKIKALRYPQPLSAYQRKVEYEHITRRANDERQQRPDFRPVIEHDGFLWQRSNNQDPNRTKTREELLAEERDYKRRRTSYRGKKMKRSTTQVMRDIIDEYMDEIKKVHGLLKAADEGEPRASESYSSRDGHLNTVSLEKNKREDKASRGENHDYGEKLHDDKKRSSGPESKRLESNLQRGDSHKLQETAENDRGSKRARYDRDYPRSPRHESDSHLRGHSRRRWKHNDPEESTETRSRSSERSHSKSDRQKNHQRKENESHSEIRNRRRVRGHPDIKSGKLNTEFEDRYNPSEFNEN